MPNINFYVRTSGIGLQPKPVVNVAAKPQRARLRQLASPNRSVELPYGPQGLTQMDMGINYVTVDRPGVKPNLVSTTKKLRMVAFDVVVADQDGGLTPIQGTLNALEEMANEDVDCQFTYGVTSLPYRVRISSFSYVSMRRDLDGNLTQAQISLELKETINVSQGVVALDAIQYPPDPKPAETDKPTGSTGDPKPPPPPHPSDADDPPAVVNVHADRDPSPPRRNKFD